jgi:hypothetical protein
MRHLLLAFALAASAHGFQAQEPAKPPAATPQAVPTATASPAGQGTQTPAQAPAAAKTEAGYMEPAQVKALLHKIWLVEYRTNDLLTDLHPEKLKISDDARHSFNEALDNLRKALTSQEDWRGRFEQRSDSLYLGYQTFMSMAAVQPRLDAVAHAVSQYENKSLGLQYTQAENQFFDLQQALEPPLESMLQNQDQLLLAAQANLASCQNQLGFAMRPRTAPAVPMKNYLPEIKGHGQVFYTGQQYPGSDNSRRTARRPTGEKKVQKRTEKKPEAKQTTAKKSATTPPPAKPTPRQ